MLRAGSVGKMSSCEYDYYDEDGYLEEGINGDDGWYDQGRTMISHIYVSFDEVIKSIQFGYLENEALVLSAKYGGYTDGSNFRAVRLKEDEYITGLTGVLAKNGRGIRNLTFYTNFGEYLIGCSSDKYPSDTKVVIDPAICDRREFGGFFGSYDRYRLTSIGRMLEQFQKLKAQLHQALLNRLKLLKVDSDDALYPLQPVEESLELGVAT